MAAKVTRGVDPEALPAVPVAALGFSYSITLDDKRQLVLQTHLPLDGTVGDLNNALDKMASAADRQAARYLVKALRKSLSLQSKQLRRVTEDLATQDDNNQAAFKRANKKGEYRLTNEQEMHRRNVLVTQQRFKEEIADIEREIREAEAIANGIDGSTDS